MGASMAVVGATAGASNAGVYDTLTPNIARNKTATSTSPSCGSGSTAQTPAKAVDGSTWTVYDKWCTTSAVKKLVVDLGSSELIKEFIIQHAGEGGESSAWNTRAFKIWTSDTGANGSWTQRVNVTDNTAKRSIHPIAPVFARYAQLEVVQAEQSGNGAARIFEFEVYGYRNLALGGAMYGQDNNCGEDATATDESSATDASLSTYWCEGVTGVGTGQLTIPQFTVDLGSVKTLTGFRVTHMGNYYQNTGRFQIRTGSALGGPVDVIYDSANSASANPSTGLINENVSTVTLSGSARYITFDALQPFQVPLALSQQGLIREFEVFGY